MNDLNEQKNEELQYIDQEEKDKYECVLDLLSQGEKDVTFEEILNFCSYILRKPIKELYSQGRELIVAYNSSMKTSNGRRLLDLLNSTMYSSANIIEIEALFKRVSSYKIIEKYSIESLNDNIFEELLGLESKKMSDDDKEKKNLLIKEEISKAKEIMILWEEIENNIIFKFCSEIDERLITVFAKKCSSDEYLQAFGELLQTLGNMPTLFSQHEGIAIQAIGLIETFKGKSIENKKENLKETSYTSQASEINFFENNKNKSEENKNENKDEKNNSLIELNHNINEKIDLENEQNTKKRKIFEESFKVSIDDYINEPWFKEIIEEFEEDKKEIIDSLTSYLETEERYYEQGMKYVFFCLKEIYN